VHHRQGVRIFEGIAELHSQRRACDGSMQRLEQEAANLKQVIGLTRRSWDDQSTSRKKAVSTCRRSLKENLDRNTRLETEIEARQVQLEKQEATAYRTKLRARAIRVIAKLTDGPVDTLAEIENKDLRNTMISALANKRKRAGSAGQDQPRVNQIVASLQSLTFEGLVHKAEATAGYGKKGKEDAYGDCIGGPADPKLVVILQEMKEEGGENFDRSNTACGDEVRNSIIAELESRTRVDVAGLQALSDDRLLQRARQVLRQGVLPQS